LSSAGARLLSSTHKYVSMDICKYILPCVSTLSIENDVKFTLITIEIFELKLNKRKIDNCVMFLVNKALKIDDNCSKCG